MNLDIDLIPDDLADEYDTFVLSVDSSLLFASWRYRVFLQRVVPRAYPRYVGAWNNGKLVGVLPLFVVTGEYGSVVNSLPFYGSNGACIVQQQAGQAEIKQALLREYRDICDDVDAVTSSIVTNPLMRDASFYDEQLDYTYREQRIGQVTVLPGTEEAGHGTEEALMASLHSKTRNCIRKGMKSGISVRKSTSEDDMRQLLDLHDRGMKAIGGRAKDWAVFKTIRDVFCPGRDYTLYIGERGGETVAALLLLYWNHTVEYFVPASLDECRIYQPMSLLIYRAMADAIVQGYRNWNWGGTWLSQSGVYQFKRRWGSEDLPYFYYTKVSNRQILHLDEETILAEYPNVFVCPFGQLKGSRSA